MSLAHPTLHGSHSTSSLRRRTRAGARKLRILEINGRNTGGNAEYVLQLCRGLDRERFDVTIAFPPGGKIDDQMYATGLPVVPLGFEHDGGLRAAARGLMQLVRLMRRERFDIVHTHTSVAGVLGRLAARLTGVPATVHMLHTLAAHGRTPPLQRRIFRGIERGFDRLTTTYVAPSRAMLDEGVANKIFTAEKARLIYNGIDFTAVEDAAKIDLRGELGLAPQTQLIGFVGRLAKQKGLPDLIEAVVKLRATRSDFCLVVVGDGPLAVELADRVRRAGLSSCVRFVGWRSDVASILHEVDILAMPSWWEAFGLAAVEAMAAGKPVVATQVQGLQEVVEQEVTGLLVPPDHPDRLADALARLLDFPQLRRLFGEHGRLRARRLFDMRRVISEHEVLFEELGAGINSPRSAVPTLPETRAA